MLQTLLITHNRALKAFITARKPRAFDARNRKSISYISGDRGARESSSSSADTGEPQTPSPQYSEAIPAGNDHAVSKHESDEEKGILVEPLDPHFARLLNSLSISASKNIDPKQPHTLNKVTLLPKTTSPSNRLRTPDWSSRVPTFSEIVVDSPVLSEAKHISTSDNRQRHPDLVRCSDFEVPSRANSSSSDTSPVVADPAATSSSTAATARKAFMSSRRSSSIADISPYLSRPAEVPTSGKRLKQLALLESVADESSKMTPTFNNRELPPIHGPDCHPPGPSPSVPHCATQVNLGASLEPSSIRSANLPPLYASHEHPTLGNPFQVRPRSSQLSQASSTYLGDRGMKNQNQAMSLLGGPPQSPVNFLGRLLPTPLPQTFSANHSTPPLNSIDPYAGATLHSFRPAHDPRAMPAARAVLSPQSRPLLPSSSVQLLSILNGDRVSASVSRTGPPSTNISVHAT